MRKIATQITEDPLAKDLEPVVNRFEARPMLLLKRIGKVVRRIPDGEAVDRWGKLLTGKDLALAKRIGGREYAEKFSLVFGV